MADITRRKLLQTAAGATTLTAAAGCLEPSENEEPTENTTTDDTTATDDYDDTSDDTQPEPEEEDSYLVEDLNEEELDALETYWQEQYQHRFQTGGNTGNLDSATLNEVYLEDDTIYLEWDTTHSTEDELEINTELTGVSGAYGRFVHESETAVGLGIEITGSNNDTYEESVDESRALEYLEDEDAGRTEQDRMAGDILEELSPAY